MYTYIYIHIHIHIYLCIGEFPPEMGWSLSKGLKSLYIYLYICICTHVYIYLYTFPPEMGRSLSKGLSKEKTECITKIYIYLIYIRVSTEDTCIFLFRHMYTEHIYLHEYR
jgi:hypothetical protein